MKKKRRTYPAVLAAMLSGLLILAGCDDEVRISYGKLISAHMGDHYPQAVPYKVERQPGGYEVSVGGSLELIYNAGGGFVREQQDF